jgi:hypothetical protein
MAFDPAMLERDGAQGVARIGDEVVRLRLMAF